MGNVIIFGSMVRRRVGITVDLTDDMECDVSALIESAQKNVVIKETKVPKETVEVSKYTYEEIDDIVKSRVTSCDDCKNTILYAPKLWKTQKLCYKCYKIRCATISEEINRYLIEKGYLTCTFCNKIREDPSDFHLDHINMYSKSGNVGEMMFSGCDIDVIKHEIDKCQLLCISCHAVVTHFEHRYGFIKAKKSRNKKTIEYMENIYDEYMGEIYSFMRGRYGKISGVL
jgi:hypothetical protein